MSKSWNQKFSIVTISALTAFMMMGYQNCGPAGQRSLFNKSSAGSFPYKATIDQVAYMSCAEQNNILNDPGVFFSFRAGAYGNAGLGLTDEFLNTHRRKDEEGKLNVLALDETSESTRLQFSLRRQNSLGQMFVNSNSGDGSETIDFDYVFGTMGSDAMSASLLTMPESQRYLNYWAAGGIHSDSRFEGSMVFNASELLAEQTRQFLQSGGGILALAFADSINPSNISGPNSAVDPDTGEPIKTSTNVAYGSGFKLQFRQPDPLNWYAGGGFAHSNMPKRVLSQMTEYDLSVPNRPVGSWSCPSSFQFRVMFPDDIGVDDPGTAAVDSYCPRVSDAAQASPELDRMRKSLPATDWHINIAKRCVEPKKYRTGSCYGIDGGTKDTHDVVYDPRSACDPAVNSVCGHYVSICYKTSVP